MPSLHSTEREGCTFCLNLEDLHNDAFSFFFTLQYCMILNGSAFIYYERWNNVTPKSSATTRCVGAQHLGLCRLIRTAGNVVTIDVSSQFKF